MMDEINIPQRFQVEYILTTIVILNKSHFRPNSEKTLYKLWYGKQTIVNDFKFFGSKCYIKNNYEEIGEFNSKENEFIFIWYSHNNKYYRCYNKTSTKILIELMSKWMSLLLSKTGNRRISSQCNWTTMKMMMNSFRKKSINTYKIPNQNTPSGMFKSIILLTKLQVIWTSEFKQEEE